MSPLVALLALACATPLLAARVRRDEPVDQCAFRPAGFKTSYALTLQRVNIQKYVPDAKTDAANNCAMANMNIVGVEVAACDCGKPPNIVVDDKAPFSPMLIHRNGDLNCVATVVITQHCQ